MANYAYERLSAQDASFLVFESPNTHMHLAWTWIFAGGSLVGDDGGVDIARVRQHVAARLFRFPRFRQRIVYTPVEHHPVWVDDAGFKLHYHVRHASLPEPGDDRRLMALASSIVSQPLDRSKPLWEMWVVEGLSGGRFAVVTKTHHCMIDGVSTVDLMTGLLDAAPRSQPDEIVDWIPRPAPGPQELWRDSILDRVSLAASMLRELGEDVGRLRAAPREAIAGRLESWRETLAASVSGAPETPLNHPPGPHRFVNWLRLEKAAVADRAQRHGGSEDDVVLTTVAGAIWRWFLRRGFRLRRQSFRVVIPAIQPRQLATQGNRAAGWIISLPVDEPDAARRFRAVARATAKLSVENQTLGLERLLQAAEIGGSVMLEAGVELSRRLHPYNLIVSRIPGPRDTRHLLDAPLLEAYPQLPLFNNQSLAIGVAQHGAHLDLGLVGDWEVTQDLSDFVDDLKAAFEEL